MVVTVLLPGLRQARKRLRMTQVELARRAELTPESVSRFENQRLPASIRAAERLAQVLGVPVKQLMGEARVSRPRQPATERVCTDCGLTKPVTAFVPIRATRTGHYGRCRACRARRARERYQTDTEERERQKARVRRNRRLKKASAVS